jgi:hypothetical protein
MSRQRQGPQPAPRRELGPQDGRAAPGAGNAARPAQSAVGGNRDARTQLAQGQFPVDQSERLDGAGSLSHLAHHPAMPSRGVELRMTAAHPENPGSQDSRGGVPTLRLEIQDNARAAVAPGYGNPDDFRAPPGAMALGGPQYVGGYETARTNPATPALETPARPAAPAAINLRREGGELQPGGRPAHARPPGWQYASASPGDMTIIGEVP